MKADRTVVLIGVFLFLIGVSVGWNAYGYIQIERGWAMVISGAIVASAGLVLAAIGFALNLLQKIAASSAQSALFLSKLTPDRFSAPALDEALLPAAAPIFAAAMPAADPMSGRLQSEHPESAHSMPADPTPADPMPADSMSAPAAEPQAMARGFDSRLVAAAGLVGGAAAAADEPARMPHWSDYAPKPLAPKPLAATPSAATPPAWMTRVAATAEAPLHAPALAPEAAPEPEAAPQIFVAPVDPDSAFAEPERPIDAGATPSLAELDNEWLARAAAQPDADLELAPTREPTPVWADSAPALESVQLPHIAQEPQIALEPEPDFTDGRRWRDPDGIAASAARHDAPDGEAWTESASGTDSASSTESASLTEGEIWTEGKAWTDVDASHRPEQGEDWVAESAEPLAEAHTLPEPASEPAGASPEAEPRPAIMGQYEANGARYVMYVDGSIDAETSHGVYHFKSMDELKRFIEQGV